MHLVYDHCPKNYYVNIVYVIKSAAYRVFKWSYDLRSYESNFCNCVEKPEKFRTSTGFEPGFEPVLFTSCLCQKPERARYKRVRIFDANNEWIHPRTKHFLPRELFITHMHLDNLANRFAGIAHKPRSDRWEQLWCRAPLLISTKPSWSSNFLNSCHTFKVFPKFVFFKIHNTSTRDNLATRKRLLKRCYYKTDKRT